MFLNRVQQTVSGNKPSQHPPDTIRWTLFRCSLRGSLQGGPGTEPEPETGTVGTVFPGTERGTGTAGTVFQEPKPEPSSLIKTVLNHKKPFPQRNRRNRKPEPLEPFHPRTVTEPNPDRGHPVLTGIGVSATFQKFRPELPR